MSLTEQVLNVLIFTVCSLCHPVLDALFSLAVYAGCRTFQIGWNVFVIVSRGSIHRDGEIVSRSRRSIHSQRSNIFQDPSITSLTRQIIKSNMTDKKRSG